MERFDWQTEEDGPIGPATSPEGVAARGTRRRTWLLLLILTTLVSVAIVIIWQLGRQAERQDQDVRKDVEAAFGVWATAVANQDGDLLSTLLMGGEAEWTAVQRELLTSGRILDRPAFGLSTIGDVLEQPGLEPRIEISRDWRAAEITFPVTYQAGDDDAVPVTLEQTVSLTREGSRWLLQRPAGDFWGVWHTSSRDLASVTYRDRDAELAERLLDDLDRALGQACAVVLAQGVCPAGTTVQVRLESDISALLKQGDEWTPSFAGRAFVLPTPTLAGKPVDAAGYQALYAAYTRPILATFKASLDTPVQMPDEVVALLCVDRHGGAPQLYTYDPSGTSPEASAWMAHMDASAFRFLAAREDDSGLILRQLMPGEPNRLRVLHWAGDMPAVVHDQTYDSLTGHGIGWARETGDSGLLLVTYQGTMRTPSYFLIDVSAEDQVACPATGCRLQELDGFPVWPASSQNTLLLAGGRVYLTGRDGGAEIDLGEGHSAFWLDERRFSFVRPKPGDDRQIQELVTGALGTRELRPYWSTADLDPASFGATSGVPFYVQHVELLPGAPARLLAYGRQYASDESKYVYLTLPAPPGENHLDPVPQARVELVLERGPAGFPSSADPNGHLPYRLSPDGRWLTAAHPAGEEPSHWRIVAAEIGQDNLLEYAAGYPGHSFNHPYLDWSADGRWLLLVDREFLRLVAPDAGFERIVPHDKRACTHAAWLTWLNGATGP